EPGAEHGAADHRGPVGGEDHVGQAGLGVDELYRVAEAGVGVVQGLPLPGGQGLVDWFPAGHPRIDRVPHGEMVRAAHQVGPGLRGPAPGGAAGMAPVTGPAVPTWYVAVIEPPFVCS